MKNKKFEKKYDLEKRSDRIKSYKRTASRIWRDRRIKAVLTFTTLAIMLAPLAVSSLIEGVIALVFSLVGVEGRVASLVGIPTLICIEFLVLLLTVSPLIYGMRAYAARAVDGEEPSAEILVGFYSNPTYRSYSRKRAFSVSVGIASVAATIVGASYLVAFLGDRLTRGGDVARAAILYFGSLIIITAFVVIMMLSCSRSYLNTALFLRSPGQPYKEIRRRASLIMKNRAEAKWESLALNSSFVGWFAVTVLTGGLAAIYVIPYVTLTNAVCRSYLCRGSDA